jgi:hypothetical protein
MSFVDHNLSAFFAGGLEIALLLASDFYFQIILQKHPQAGKKP